MTLEELRNDEALAEELLKAKNLDEVFACLRSNGVEFDEAEIREACSKLSDEEELDETALEDVAGGANVLKAAYIGWKLLPKILPLIPRPKYPKNPHRK